MKSNSIIAVDISKNVFQLHGIDELRKVVLKKRLYRGEVLGFFGNLAPCTVVMESCGGSHYWARELELFGHTVKLVAGEFVKSYVHGNKNDQIDAAAISEAYLSPRVNFVGVNSIEQQDLQMKHRVRSRLVRVRTAIVNELHGFLLEYGVVISRSVKEICSNVTKALEEAGDKISINGRVMFGKLCDEVRVVQRQIAEIDAELKELAKTNDVAKRVCTIPGVGPITATAILAAVADPHVFKNGRHFAASLGLVPRQISTGGKTRLGRITKRGDRYIRSLLVQGAQSSMVAIRHFKSGEPCPERITQMKSLLGRCGRAKAAVAIANRNARIVWAILSKPGEVYNPCFKHAIA